MPFFGEQGSYCWAGIATTNQSTTTASRTCHAAALPKETTGLPTIAVYPQANLSFWLPNQGRPTSLQATLFESGSMKLVSANASAVGGFALGSLPVGDYILRVNASFDRSFTSAYYGIKQIGSVNYGEGNIKISIGSPSVQTAGLTTAGASLTFPGLEVWPLTFSSAQLVSHVNLTSISVISGDWVRFLPSYLPEVGPNGTVVKMLLVGAVRPFVNNDISNVTMIIRATASGGAFGEAGLPLEGSGGPIVLHSLAANQEFQSGTFMVQAADQKNGGIESIVYDPPSAIGNESLPVTASIAGFYGSNGSVLPQPSWLQFYLPQSSTNLSITPYNPLYFVLDYASTSAAPLGTYTLVLDVQVGSANLTVFILVVVGPAMHT
jgi:hypothetical protein